MANLTNALQQLRAERSRAQSEVEKLDQAISVIESLNGSGASRKANRPTRIVSAASRRKMALAQKARWAKARNGSQPAKAVMGSAPPSAPCRHQPGGRSRRRSGHDGRR
jgi:phage major head subunit gpT-like protein